MIAVATDYVTHDLIIHINGLRECSQLEIKNTNKNNQELLLQHEIEVIQGIMDSKAKYRKIVQAGISHWVKEFQEKRIEIKSIDDLRKLIEMDIELQKEDL